MQDEKAFRLFLSKGRVGKRTGKIVSPRAVGDCISRLRRAEIVLGMEAGHKLADESAVRSLADRLKDAAGEQGLSDSAVRDCTAALRRYAEFQASRQRQRPAKLG